jgi:hypothetical protein
MWCREKISNESAKMYRRRPTSCHRLSISREPCPIWRGSSVGISEDYRKARQAPMWDRPSEAAACRRGEFITSGNWRGKHNSLSRGAVGAYSHMAGSSFSAGRVTLDLGGWTVPAACERELGRLPLKRSEGWVGGGRRRRKRRTLFRIVHARGAIPNVVGPTRCREEEFRR